jgi:hypothetical protein
VQSVHFGLLKSRGAGNPIQVLTSHWVDVFRKKEVKQMSTTADESVEVTLDLHKKNFRCLQLAAAKEGLSERDFCVLAIHRESCRVLAAPRTIEPLPSRRILAEGVAKVIAYLRVIFHAN